MSESQSPPDEAEAELAYTPSGPIPAADAKRLKAHGQVVDLESSPLLLRALGREPATKTEKGTHRFYVDNGAHARFAAEFLPLAQPVETADQTDAAPMDEAAVAKARALDEDPDKADDGDTDVEHFPLPAGLLADAELTDEDSDDADAEFDALPTSPSGGIS
jgi:hypothetical protein